MNVNMPKPVAVYMNATNNADLDSLDSCLTPDATISDVGENDNIAGLARESKEKFKLHADIRQVEEDGGKTKVTTLTSGDFPTSPQYFCYIFTFAGGLIKDINIVPGEANVKE